MRVILAHGGVLGLIIESIVVAVPLGAIVLLRRMGKAREQRHLEANAAARRAARAQRQQQPARRART